MQLPGLEHSKLMRPKWRMNRKPNTLRGSFQAVRSFLTFYVSKEEWTPRIASDDLEVYVEHEQDRGLRLQRSKRALIYIWAFLRFLSNRTSSVREFSDARSDSGCQFSTKSHSSEWCQKILAAVKKLVIVLLFLVLLRTGMRIGELLGLKWWISICVGRRSHLWGWKNSLGRVVYLSDDALMALRLWLKKRW